MASQKLCAGCLRLPATPAGPPPPLRRPHSPHSNALQIQRSRAPGSLHSCPPARSSAASFARAGYCVLFKVSRQNGWSRHALLRHPRSRHAQESRARTQPIVNPPLSRVCFSSRAPPNISTWTKGASLSLVRSPIHHLPSRPLSLLLARSPPPPSSSFLFLPSPSSSPSLGDGSRRKTHAQQHAKQPPSCMQHPRAHSEKAL